MEKHGRSWDHIAWFSISTCKSLRFRNFGNFHQDLLDTVNYSQRPNSRTFVTRHDPSRRPSKDKSSGLAGSRCSSRLPCRSSFPQLHAPHNLSHAPIDDGVFGAYTKRLLSFASFDLSIWRLWSVPSAHGGLSSNRCGNGLLCNFRERR